MRCNAIILKVRPFYVLLLEGIILIWWENSISYRPVACLKAIGLCLYNLALRWCFLREIVAVSRIIHMNLKRLSRLVSCMTSRFWRLCRFNDIHHWVLGVFQIFLPKSWASARIWAWRSSLMITLTSWLTLISTSLLWSILHCSWSLLALAMNWLLLISCSRNYTLFYLTLLNRIVDHIQVCISFLLNRIWNRWALNCWITTLRDRLYLLVWVWKRLLGWNREVLNIFDLASLHMENVFVAEREVLLDWFFFLNITLFKHTLLDLHLINSILRRSHLCWRLWGRLICILLNHSGFIWDIENWFVL